MTDPILKPSHFNRGDIECLDALVAARGEDAVREHAICSALAYLWRAGYKGDYPEEKRAEDCAKAAFYARFAAGDDPRRDREPKPLKPGDLTVVNDVTNIISCVNAIDNHNRSLAGDSEYKIGMTQRIEALRDEVAKLMARLTK